jgi:hypothetical protein
VAYYGAGANLQNQMTNLGSLRIAQVEAPGLEMARSGRSFVGGTTLVAGAVVPVVDLPTTTGPLVLFNSSAQGPGQKHLVLKRISCFYGSGTLTATGFGLFAGVTPSVLATPLTANGATNFRTQCVRGTSPPTPLGFIDVAKTIPAGTAWMHLGGVSVVAAAATTGPAYTVDVSSHPFIVPPLFAVTVGVLGDTGTTAKYGFSLYWDEVELILP